MVFERDRSNDNWATQWEDVQFREDEINGELYNFSYKILNEATMLNKNVWVDVKMDFK
jgi:hypothetical protein